MKRVLLAFLFILSLIVLTQGVFAESMTFCDTTDQSAKFEFEVQPEPPSCFIIRPDWGDCSYGLMLMLINDCNETLVYVHEFIDEEGNEKINELEFGGEVYPFSMPITNMPQENGVEWARKVYYKDSPNEMFIISGKTINIQEQEQQEVGDVYTSNTNNQNTEKPGFFKRSWTWFKCLFSRKC
jgi:hypothetical protein